LIVRQARIRIKNLLQISIFAQIVYFRKAKSIDRIFHLLHLLCSSSSNDVNQFIHHYGSMISSWYHQVSSLCPFVISKLRNYRVCYGINIFCLLTISTNNQNKITHTYGGVIGKHIRAVWITGFGFPGIRFNIEHLD